MKTKIFTGLAVAAALLVGQPLFAAKPAHRPVARHVHAAVHPVASRGHAIAHTNNVVAQNHTQFKRSTALAAHGTSRATITYNYAQNRSVNRSSHTNVAFGGSTSNNNNVHRTFAFASHAGWNNGQEYFRHGHHYHWYNNGWFIIDPYPYGYGYGSNYGGYDGAYYGSSVGGQVQAALQQAGYYQGPIDGIVGPGTSQAIANYQRDNGLAVTGTITNGLLRNLGIG
jgi:hypothetical protein